MFWIFWIHLLLFFIFFYNNLIYNHFIILYKCNRTYKNPTNKMWWKIMKRVLPLFRGKGGPFLTHWMKNIKKESISLNRKIILWDQGSRKVNIKTIQENWWNYHHKYQHKMQNWLKNNKNQIKTMKTKNLKTQKYKRSTKSHNQSQIAISVSSEA